MNRTEALGPVIDVRLSSRGVGQSAYDTYSMRQTRAAQIFKTIGNLRVVQPLLGHTKMNIKVRYLGIDIAIFYSLAEVMEGLASEGGEEKVVMIDATYLNADRTASSLRAKFWKIRGAPREQTPLDQECEEAVIIDATRPRLGQLAPVNPQVEESRE